jgi:hypothetical protein
MRTTAHRPAAGLVRPFWAAALAVAVFLGAVDYHPAGEVHAFGESADAAHSAHGADGAEVSFSSTARHPNQPLHLESSEAGTRPLCPLCLHRLQTSGGHLSASPAGALPVLCSVLPTGSVAATAGASHHPREARAPPAV